MRKEISHSVVMVTIRFNVLREVVEARLTKSDAVLADGLLLEEQLRTLSR